MSTVDEQLSSRSANDPPLDPARPTVPVVEDQQIRWAAALGEIACAMTASLNAAASFEVIAQQAQQFLAYDSLAVLLPSAEPDRAGTDAWIVAFCHAAALEPGLVVSLADLSFGPALRAGRPVIIEDSTVSAASYAGDRLILNSGGRAAVIAPIQAASRVLGALMLISQTPGLYQPADVRWVEFLADLLALALEHQRLDQQARALAVVEERNRLAREIHDTLAHSLAGIIINLESLKPYTAGRSRADAEVLDETEGLARGALAEARRSVLGLQPTPLQHQSLRDALAPELAGLARRAGLVTQFYVHGVERSLAPDVAIALFRVAQEVFHNIDKHAAARHVILGLAFEEDVVMLTVEDDGVGFVPDTAIPNDTSSFGLLSMAARAHSVGGELHVTSYRGHGTAVRATVPYTRPRSTPAAVVPTALSPVQPLPRPIRVLVVDNHPTTRQGIRRILDGEPDIQVVGEAADGLGAIEQTERLHPDVVLLDLLMPRLSGVEALPRLRAAHSSVEVVVLTMFDQDEQIFASLKAGARGYVLKDAAPEAIVAAVRAAGRQESSLPLTFGTHLVERFSLLAQRDVDPDALTEREVTLLGYMAQGLPYKVIAAQLNVSTHTVQYHVTNILQKLHVGNRGEAVAVAVQRGLLNQAK